MSDTIRCPDCGHGNAPERESCEHCNFPLGERHGSDVAGASPGMSTPRAAAPDTPSAPGTARIPRRPGRPRRSDPVSLQLWLIFAVIAGAIVLYIAVKANVERTSVPVEGSSADQQRHADELLAALETDSTNVDARIGLGNVYYDTGNWADAALHYRRALAQDSTRIGALVDLGVCYYNLGQTQDAERLFTQALGRDPHHPIALFNLGIVAERHDQPDEALQYYHRCLQSGPPDEMRQPLIEAMARLQQKTGRKPPPLPDGS